MICTKVKIANYAQCVKVIAKMNVKYGGDFGAYYCASCNCYHLTSKKASSNNFVKFQK
jgi:hypothetical protein